MLQFAISAVFFFTVYFQMRTQVKDDAEPARIIFHSVKSSSFVIDSIDTHTALTQYMALFLSS